MAGADAGGAQPMPTPPVEPVASAPRRSLAADLVMMAIVGVLLLAAIGAATAAVARDFYSPAAFVERYLGMLSDGRAADALSVSGVAVDSSVLENAGMPIPASDALLRGSALGALTDVRILSEETDGEVTRVTASYTAGRYPGTTTFDVERDGSIGLAPTWRFATSPLALIDLTVRGSMTFDINGFTIDKRQISPDGADADPMATMPLLVFSPGIYSVTVDTILSSTPGIAVLSDAPLKTVPLDLQAEPTEQFVDVVQQRVDAFLTACAEQPVLQPTGCPFGYPVEDRIVDPPVWSIAAQPRVTLVADGAGWRIPTTDAVAHIEVDIRSIFDGSVRHVSEDVPFLVSGRIEIQPDGSASITVEGTDTL